MVLLLPVVAAVLMCRRLYLQHEETVRLEEASDDLARPGFEGPATAAGSRPALTEEEAARRRREDEIIAQMEMDFHAH